MASSSFYELFGSISLLLIILWLIFKILKGIWTCHLGYALGFGVKWRPSSKTWAVITGGTDGIGLAYAKEFARMGYNLCLISRNPQKLQTVKEQIKQESSKCSEIYTIAVDFTEEKADLIYDKIETELNILDGDIDILVNNVGISYEYPEYFNNIPESKKLINSIINCNMLSVIRMIQLILPKMEKRKRGIVINISSYSASYPLPLLALYASSKMFVDFLSRSLQFEYFDKGIIIQSVLPAFVSTKMSKIRHASIMVPNAQTYVHHALKTVGIETRTYGYWAHKLQGFFQDCLIANILGDKFNSKLAFDSLLDVRRRYFKKHGNKADASFLVASCNNVTSTSSDGNCT